MLEDMKTADEIGFDLVRSRFKKELVEAFVDVGSDGEELLEGVICEVCNVSMPYIGAKTAERVLERLAASKWNPPD